MKNQAAFALSRSFPAWLMLAVTPLSYAQNQALKEDAVPLTRLSLQDLRNVEVTTVSRREESLLQAPSAVYVLDQDDIRRSGHLSIPEALRGVPGLNVARINANKWAISSRGFNNRFANKMLVLMDGRTVYTHVFSGVYWNTVDTFLPDIDRIEVVRGPGGTLWGANAVNGVINILTKDARETQGVVITGGYGNENEGFGGFRYGGKLAEDWYYRVYATAINRQDFRELNGLEGADENWHQQEGFRIDWIPSEENKLTIQGDYYYNRAGDRMLVPAATPPAAVPVVEDARANGYNLLSRWSRETSADSGHSLQFYYDGTMRENINLGAEIHTLDLDFQQRIAPLEQYKITWGAGYRLLMDDLENSPYAEYNPSSRRDQLFSAFLQNEFELAPEKVFWTVGSKFEHNDYTGFEIQPSTRLSWRVSERQTFWGSISRAVRTPARFEQDVFTRVALPGSPFHVHSLGNPRFRSEELLAYELGYRIQVTEDVFLDLAAFYNDYEHLRTSTFIGSGGGIATSVYGNDMEGETYGFEFAPSWQVTPYWRLSAGYSYLDMQLHLTSGTVAATGEAPELESPENSVFLRSYLDLPRGFQLDSSIYYVDSISQTPSYTRLDFRLAWFPKPNLELSVVVQNTLDPGHNEFGAAPLVTPTEVERNIYGKVTWRF